MSISHSSGSLPRMKEAQLDAVEPAVVATLREHSPPPETLVFHVSQVRRYDFLWCRGTLTFHGVSVLQGYCPRMDGPWELEVGAAFTVWQWGSNEATFSTLLKVGQGEVSEAEYRVVYERVSVRLRFDWRATLWQWVDRV